MILVSIVTMSFCVRLCLGGERKWKKKKGGGEGGALFDRIFYGDK
jgi:hypothetical protein